MDQTHVQYCMESLIKDGLDLNLNDPNFEGTPARIAKMYCNEFFSNCNCEFTDYASFPNDRNYNQIISFPKISFISMCPHHFLPVSGFAWFFYIPNKILIGASKPARLIKHYSKQPILQESLGEIILDRFEANIRPLGCMIYIDGVHGCMAHRGIEEPDSGMITSIVRGNFKVNPYLEEKALKIIELSLMLRR
jgi:GTP cyclohydrolase IA